MKKIIAAVLCAFILTQSLTACTVTVKNDGEEKEEKYEDRIMTDRDETEKTEETDETDEIEENEEIGGFFEEDIADITEMAEMTGINGIDGIDGIDITFIPFTPQRVVGLDPEWSWAVVEIGWNGYGNENRWRSYVITDDEQEYEYQYEEEPPPEETQTPTTDQTPAAPDGQGLDLPQITAGKTWPAAYLPPDLPVYPDGEISVYADSGGETERTVDVFAENTSQDSFMKYLDMLKGAGFVLDELIESKYDISITGGKDIWLFKGIFYGGSSLKIYFIYDIEGNYRKLWYEYT